MSHLKRSWKPWNPDGGRYPWLCGDFDMLIKHAKSFVTGNRYSKVCVLCGAASYADCGTCGVALYHQFSNRGRLGAEAKHCFMYWHNTNHFGLAKSETLNYQPNKRKSDWKEPSNVVEKDRRTTSTQCFPEEALPELPVILEAITWVCRCLNAIKW